MNLRVKLTAKAVKLIDGRNFAYLATIMYDGSPNVTPVWIDRIDDTILVNTAEGRVKQRNVTGDPRVVIAITDQNKPYDKVLIRGIVKDQTTHRADEHIDRLAKKYIGKDKYPWRAPGEKRIMIKIEPLRVSN